MGYYVIVVMGYYVYIYIYIYIYIDNVLYSKHMECFMGHPMNTWDIPRQIKAHRLVCGISYEQFYALYFFIGYPITVHGISHTCSWEYPMKTYST